MTSRGVSRDMTGSSGGGPALHGSVTVSIIHNIDAAGLYNEVDSRCAVASVYLSV